ncbi:hypothetical protein [Actinomadura algeriensis]|uniref:Uncharacterized protein n=1 Tax=Actinomadura algeriensis TaxID=1679523 RepID=A0ABR9K2I4_9ACTN|nr:hypothetical protein [Actinomadura algeriensis]MBE1537038.1 hypothetical protein [Actinomadura algeriensis]
MSSNDLQLRNNDDLPEHGDQPIGRLNEQAGERAGEHAIYHALATLVVQAVSTWQTTFRLATLFVALALPATAILILYLQIQ